MGESLKPSGGRPESSLMTLNSLIVRHPLGVAPSLPGQPYFLGILSLFEKLSLLIVWLNLI